MQEKKPERIMIPFNFDMFDFENRNHVVEKADKGGQRRRYLKGISSGISIDAHGERMTENCIRKMQEQANSGSILLYEGQHGVTHTEDLGILTESEITTNNEWITTFRLYDSIDFPNGGATLERADKLWAQMNGLPPYIDNNGNPKPLQKGFSIEGYIPPDGIIQANNEGGQRVIDNVELDGVLVTPRPAFQPSVATAIYKALGEMRPEKKLSVAEGIRNSFDTVLEDEKLRESYYNKRYKLMDVLDDSIERIMSKGYQIEERLKLLFDEYGQTMIRLLTEHAEVFYREPGSDISENDGALEVAKNMQRVHVLKNIQDQLAGFVNAKSFLVKTKK